MTSKVSMQDYLGAIIIITEKIPLQAEEKFLQNEIKSGF